MSRYFRIVPLALTITILFWSYMPKASACGGLFCTSAPVDQTAERIIFAVDKPAGTITAVVGISYTGDSKSFSWVVPVPNPPTLDVAETKSLDVFSAATNLQFKVPSDPCPTPTLASVPMMAGAAEAPTSNAFLQTGQVGPYDYAIIKNEKTDEMITWLRTNGYQITKAMEPLVVQYVKEGMYFLAMRLQPDKAVSEIKPVVMTYHAEHPMIPLRLTAVAAVDDMQVVVWILGESQYIPDNYAHPAVDFRQMRAGFQTIQESGLTYTTLTTYKVEQKRLQTEFNGLAFITEYAQPSSALLSAISSQGSGTLDGIVAGLLIKHPYVTRLRAQMSPNQMTLDPPFQRTRTCWLSRTS